MQILFPEGELEFFPSMRTSKIRILLDMWVINPLKQLLEGTEIQPTNALIEEYIREVFGTKTRDVVRYSANEDFILKVGNFAPMAEIPIGQTEIKARKIILGDTILIRYDAARPVHEPHYDLQILSAGLFNSFDEDWRIFTLTERDLASILHLINQETRVLDGVGFTVQEFYEEFPLKKQRKKRRRLFNKKRFSNSN